MVIKKRFSINNIYAKTVLKKYNTSQNYTQLHQLGSLRERWKSALETLALKAFSLTKKAHFVSLLIRIDLIGAVGAGDTAISSTRFCWVNQNWSITAKSNWIDYGKIKIMHPQKSRGQRRPTGVWKRNPTAWWFFTIFFQKITHFRHILIQIKFLLENMILNYDKYVGVYLKSAWAKSTESLPGWVVYLICPSHC